MREKVNFNGLLLDSELVEVLSTKIQDAAKEVAVKLGVEGYSPDMIEKAVKNTITALANVYVYLYAH